MVMRARSGSIAHPGHLNFEQAISNQSLCQCLAAARCLLLRLGSHSPAIFPCVSQARGPSEKTASPKFSSWLTSRRKPLCRNSPFAFSYQCCSWGAKRSGNELSALLVNGTPARTCGKWPILRKAASLLSGNLTRTPGPDLLVGPFQGDFLSVSSNQCTFG